MHNVCAVVKLTSLAILLPVGSPPPLGLRFCQNIEWLMCPPPLNLIAFCTAMTPLTSSAHRECTGKFTDVNGALHLSPDCLSVASLRCSD